MTLMTRQQRIHEIISTTLSPAHLKIEDETQNHSVPVGSESHFKLLIVSSHFKQLNRVARHRLINHLVTHEFSRGLHALSLHLYTPDEWEQKNTGIPASPICKGGSRQK